MALIEFIAALALSATLLVTMLTAFSRAIRQEHLAKQRLEAVSVAEDLLSTWLAPSGTLPLPETVSTPSSGEISRHDGWCWRLWKLPPPDDEHSASQVTLSAEMARLEIISQEPQDADSRPLLSVEFATAISFSGLDAGGDRP